MAKKPETLSRIADNKKAAFNYFFEERHEAGMVLHGWEVKALREGKVQLTDGYVVIREGELYLIGCQINPLKTASTHVSPDAVRTKKLLLHKGRDQAPYGQGGAEGLHAGAVEPALDQWPRQSARSRSPRARPSTTSATPSRSARASARWSAP